MVITVITIRTSRFAELCPDFGGNKSQLRPEAVLRGDTELVRLLCSRSERTAQSQETLNCELIVIQS